jgi:hypothetical protein
METLLPDPARLAQAMELLGVPGDPAYLMKDHPEAVRRAELLAHLSAWLVNQLRQAEALADLGVDDAADLHWRADLDVAGPSRQSMDTRRLLNLQLARLAWVHHSVSRSRGNTAPDSVAGTVCTVLAAVIGVLEASRDGNLGSSTEPTYTDSLLALTLAADRVVRELRLIRLEWR